MRSFKSVYIKNTKQIKDKQTRDSETTAPNVQQVDFTFVLFASALIYYNYIMGLIALHTQRKQKGLMQWLFPSLEEA